MSPRPYDTFTPTLVATLALLALAPMANVTAASPANAPRIVADDKTVVLKPPSGGLYAVTLAKGAEIVLSDTDAAPVVEALPAGAPRPFGLPAKTGK